MLKKSEKSVVLLLQHDQPYKHFGIKNNTGMTTRFDNSF